MKRADEGRHLRRDHAAPRASRALSGSCSRPQFVATFGGGEANVAVALAASGCRARYVTVLPENNPIADAAIARAARLRRRYLRASCAARAAWASTSSRPAPTSAPRRWSTTATAAPSRSPSPATSTGRRVFDGAGWFHITGITPGAQRIGRRACARGGRGRPRRRPDRLAATSTTARTSGSTARAPARSCRSW